MSNPSDNAIQRLSDLAEDGLLSSLDSACIRWALAEIQRLRADKERLDWLEKYANTPGVVTTLRGGGDLREAIDSASKRIMGGDIELTCDSPNAARKGGAA